MTDAPTFDATSTSEEVLAGTDLSGTTALVTGASAGLGVETVRVLSGHGARVVAAARDLRKARRNLEAAGVEIGDRVTLEEVDLASLDSVRAFTDRVASELDHLDLLVANAGVMACPEGRTVDGFETQFGTNHLGHFLLVNRLVPLLVAGAPSRVVVLSSSGHRISDVDLDDPGFERTPYEAWEAYGRSKTANSLCAVALDRRLAEHGSQAMAVHPGFIITDLGRHLTRETYDALQARWSDAREQPFQKTVEQGAATTVWAATSPDLAGQPAWFYEDCARAEPTEDPAAVHGVRPYAVDPERAEALWALSERLVG
jgi:NAD(P)-dependent dehydrogenase (short-subunit alcohol dehydrogenase family)